MDLPLIFQKLAVAFGLGLLVGVQRERTSAASLAGIRTFPLVTVFGAVCALLAEQHSGWIIAAGLLTVAALLVIGNLTEIRAGHIDSGVTTEAAVLLMFGIGAYSITGPLPVVVVLGGTVAVLLHFKPEMHGLARRIGDTDFQAAMQFVIVALVILPILPDKTFGPFDVLNPHRIWWMVVLITGISLGGYIAYKLLGGHAGAAAGGILGGIISSTATTVSYARRSRQSENGHGLVVVVIMLASTIVFARIIALVGIFASEHLWELALPLALMFTLMAVLSGICWIRVRGETLTLTHQGNPTELKSALVFTALFAIVLLAIAAAREYFGQQGLYAVAALSGLTDLDAITLSSAQLIRDGRIDATTAWRLILIGAMANLIFKGATVSVLGSRALARQLWVLFGIGFLGGAAILVFLR